MTDIFQSLPILIFIPLISTIFILMSPKDKTKNIYHTSQLAVIANIVIILRFFTLIDPSLPNLQLITNTQWLKHLEINFVFGADAFSLYLILAVHIVFFVVLSCLKFQDQHPKTIASFALIFLSMITGLLISADLFSFYLFFEAMLLPLFFIIGVGGGLKKQEKIYSFFMYNFFSAILFLIAIIMIFNIDKSAYILKNTHQIKLDNITNYFIWTAIFISLLSRLPLWPFHKMLSTITSDIKNPLVFLISNLMPLTSIFAFARILSANSDENMQTIYFILQIIAVFSMLLISLISFAHKDFQYKMFSYTAIMYLFYFIASLYDISIIKNNISLSFFGFIIAISGIELLWHRYQSKADGFSKNRYIIFTGLLFCLIGAPLSSIFINNFTILGAIYKNSAISTYLIYFAITTGAVSIISQIPKTKVSENKQKVPKTIWLICFILLASFISPFNIMELYQ